MFCLSSLGLVCYAARLLARQQILIFEVLLLALRCINEICSSKFDESDAMHHGATVLGIWLVSSQPFAQSSNWVVIHMQVLHIPMALWYTSCRGTSVMPQWKPSIAVLFSIAWDIAAGYRAGVLFFLAAAHFYQWSLPAAFACSIFCSVFVYLDTYWEGCFFNSPGMPDRDPVALAVAKGVGAVAAGVVVAVGAV
jgi:hypothetical protein